MTANTTLLPVSTAAAHHLTARKSLWRVAVKVAAYISGFVALALVTLWRLPPATQSVLWAEDGNIFIGSALAPHQTWTPFEPYAGYLHFVPRLLAEVVVRFFPVSAYANAAAIASCMVVAAVAFATFHCSSAVTSSLSARAAWAAIPVLVNVGAIETLGNLANIHWYFLWLAPWLLIRPAHSGGGALLLFSAGAAASLTEIIIVLFAPLFLYKLTDRRYWPARAGLALGLVCQAYTTLSYPREGSPSEPLEPVSILFGWLLNTSGPIAYGDPRSFVSVILQFGPSPIILAAAVVLSIVAAALVIGRQRERWLVALFLAASVAVWAACAALNPAPHLDYASYTATDWTTSFWYSRYAVVPTMFALALIPVLALAAGRLHRLGRAAVLAGFCIMLGSMYFPTYTHRDGGPDWIAQVEAAEDQCMSGNIESAELTVAPSYYLAKVTISCDLLTRL